MRGVAIPFVLVLLAHGSPAGAATAAKANPSAPAASSKPASPSATAPDVAARRKAEGWPDTRAGGLAAGWVEAFAAGEDAMRAFLKQNVSDASLGKRGIPERLDTYRRNREKYGAWMLLSVVKQEPGALTVKLMATDGATETFVFTTEPAAPFKLDSVGMLQTLHMNHFGFHH